MGSDEPSRLSSMMSLSFRVASHTIQAIGGFASLLAVFDVTGRTSSSTQVLHTTCAQGFITARSRSAARSHREMVKDEPNMNVLLLSVFLQLGHILPLPADVSASESGVKITESSS